MKRLGLIALAIIAITGGPLPAQRPIAYTGTVVTGQLVLTGTVNALQLAQQVQTSGAFIPGLPEAAPTLPRRLHPPVSPGSLALANPPAQSLPVSPAGGSGFNGVSQLDQRLSNNGNQFSIEPPSPSIAVANGFLVEGVNNAFQVYTTAGIALLPKVLSTNELFGLPAAINRTTGVYGAFPTDMRVFFDQSINRWFILQRAQDYDVFRNPLNRSHLYLAVSQSGDPTGTYNIYTMDTTDALRPGCPCVADYPQIGADQYGFYISSNEFNTFTLSFVNAQILAISKASLAAGASAPAAYNIPLPFTTGYEFALQPAVTPPGASYQVASGGVEYLVSSNARVSVDSSLSIWALFNTASLNTANPNLTVTQTVIPTLTYSFPDVATQRPGPLPYGSTLIPPGSLAYLDGGDTRVLSVSYAGGRLYATLATQLVDESGRSVVGGAYVILSPTYRAGTLAAQVLRQGYLLVRNNHLLRPAVAVNAQGRGAISFTLVGPDYYPSAAFLPIDTVSTGGVVQLAGAGAFPEDGFTGYPGGFGPGVARWGDYSAAFAAADGSIWMTAEYIPNAPRTELANWGTFLMRFTP